MCWRVQNSAALSLAEPVSRRGMLCQVRGPVCNQRDRLEGIIIGGKRKNDPFAVSAGLGSREHRQRPPAVTVYLSALCDALSRIQFNPPARPHELREHSPGDSLLPQELDVANAINC